jgi:hypothetical protein
VKLDSLWIQLGLIELPGAARSPLPPSPVTA